MPNMEHKRFKLDLVELDGKMLLIDDVEIIDISLGGVSLKVGRPLNIGKEYLITIAEKGKRIEVKGIVVHCTSGETAEQAIGGHLTSHTARIKFKDGQTVTIAGLLNSVQPQKKEAAPVTPERRLHVRFFCTIPLDTVLSHSAHFRIKKITPSGMFIQSEQALEINSLIPMNISLNAEDPINLSGRIVSCQMSKDTARGLYEIEVEFTNLTDKDRKLLKSLVEEMPGPGR